MVKCPSCNYSNIILLESISTDLICEVHEKNLAFNPSYLFKDTKILTFNHCENCGLKFFFPFILGDSKYYSELGKNEWYYEHEGKEEFEFAANLILKGERVLDVGSGIGRFQKYLNSDVFYQGIELSDYAVATAQKNGINVIQEDLFKLAHEKPKTFDTVVTFQVMEHINTPKDFFLAMKNLLVPGGKLIVAVPNNDSLLFITENQSLNSPPHHTLMWNEKSLRSIGELLDFEVVQVFKESVQEIHKNWFYKAFSRHLISSSFLKEKKFLNPIHFQVLNIFTSLMGKMFAFFKIVDHKKASGLSIVVVFKKKN